MPREYVRYKKIKSRIYLPDPEQEKEEEEEEEKEEVSTEPQKKARPIKRRWGGYTSSCTRYIFPVAVEKKANAEWIQPHQHAVMFWKDISGEPMFWAVTCKSHEPRDIKDAMYQYRYPLSPGVLEEKRKASDRLKEKISILDDYCLEDLDDCSVRTKVNVKKLKAYANYMEGRVIEITPEEAERYLSKQGQALPKMVEKVSEVGQNPQVVGDMHLQNYGLDVSRLDQQRLCEHGLDDHEPMVKTNQKNIGTDPSDRDSMMDTDTGPEHSRLEPECTNPGGSENTSHNSISLETDLSDTMGIPGGVGEQHKQALAEKQKKTPNSTDVKECLVGNQALEVMEEIIRDMFWLGDSAESLEAVALFDIEGVEHQLMRPKSQRHSTIGADL
ncbi:uncharacterized protein H6S33_011318 [Morchella sextelata]|uniref:uncharacterized protein n=1 Tax=Morchella sextelata TaxID=1174677 RepID=UPI001D049C2C|nr:uncharacterized protein H6S33_011318 [Morchella sextelata]KAH0610891.1 hypothetical protein H6S33_011318 [Morchella sextelata]